MLFVASSQSPGVSELSRALLPMSYGLHTLVNHAGTRNTALTLKSLMSIPAIFTMARGFLFVAARQISSMAGSGLLPRILKKQHEEELVPLAALVGVSILCLLVMFPVHYLSKNSLHEIFYIAMLGNYMINICFFWCYVTFKSKYESLDRSFVSPMGVFGAYYGILVFTLGIVSIAAFQNDQQQSIVIFGAIIAFGALYYFCHARSTQCFSEEEQKVLFVAYVINGECLRCTFLRFYSYRIFCI